MIWTDYLKATLENRLLDELYLLTETEKERELTEEETNHYLKLVSLLQLNDIHIPFGYVV